jgi:hypothetical protein
MRNEDRPSRPQPLGLYRRHSGLHLTTFFLVCGELDVAFHEVHHRGMHPMIVLSDARDDLTVEVHLSSFPLAVHRRLTSWRLFLRSALCA